MVGIDAHMILEIYSARTILMVVKAIDTQCRTETDVSKHSEDGGKPNLRLRKTDIQRGNTRSLVQAERESDLYTTIDTPISVSAL